VEKTSSHCFLHFFRAFNPCPNLPSQVQVLLDEGDSDALVLELMDDPVGFRPFAEEARVRRASAGVHTVGESELRLIELPCETEDQGFALTGYSAEEAGPQPSGVYVATVVEGSPAQRLGLQVGDQVIELSGTSAGAWHSMRNATHQFAQDHIAAMRARGGTYSLVVAETLEGYVAFSERTSGQKRRVILQRSSIEESLGFEVVGPDTVSTIPGHCGVFVVEIDSLSPAYGRGLRVGDQILEVNGTMLTGLCHDKAHRHVMQACGDVAMLLRSNPAGFRRAPHVAAYRARRRAERVQGSERSGDQLSPEAESLPSKSSAVAERRRSTRLRSSRWRNSRWVPSFPSLPFSCTPTVHACRVTWTSSRLTCWR